MFDDGSLYISNLFQMIDDGSLYISNLFQMFDDGSLYISNLFQMFDDGSLYISNLGLRSIGNYTCQDTQNNDVVQTHIVKVQCK